ncbi:MAG: hypothetical protein V1774_10170 [Candidatus Eisenbacteria bacterium]
MTTLLFTLILSGFVLGAPPLNAHGGPVAPGAAALASPAVSEPAASAREMLCLQEGMLGGVKIPADSTEVASDCPDAAPARIIKAIWWGGYTAWEPGDPEILTFDVRFYHNVDCRPQGLIAQYLAATPDTFRLGNCNDGLPCLRYELDVDFFASGPFWLSIMVTPSALRYPPKWGRLGDEIDVGCQNQGFDAAFGTWTPLGDPYDSDASQGFLIEVPTPTEGKTWGRIKSTFQ